MSEPIPASTPRRAIIAVALAIAVTTTMDANHLSVFSALPLFPIMLVLWYLDRIPRSRMGFVWGRPIDYGVAILYPLIVMLPLAAVAMARGETALTGIDWAKGWRNAALMGAATIVGGLLTEEGFFRGWLWAALENCGFTSGRVVFLTSLAFAAWHVSAVVLPTGFDLPARQVPIFLANVMAIGTAWGLMRRASRSIVVTSVSHSVWNGLAYSFFGFGTKTGVLGVTAPDIWGPEVGVAGLVLNIAFVAVLWRTSRDHLRGTTPASSD